MPTKSNAVKTETIRFEARWPPALSVVFVVALLHVLPGRIQVFPIWTVYVLALLVLIPLGAVGLTSASGRWLTVERAAITTFLLAVGFGTLITLAYLIDAMLSRTAQASGSQLPASSIVLCMTNVLLFSFAYWLIDRGGPESRANNQRRRADWLFPQEGAPAEMVPQGWHPTFIDYLYLAYSTATAFSTTEVAPLTPRAKMLMMLESSISLVTILLVVSRAVNVLGA